MEGEFGVFLVRCSGDLMGVEVLFILFLKLNGFVKVLLRVKYLIIFFLIILVVWVMSIGFVSEY